MEEKGKAVNVETNEEEEDLEKSWWKRRRTKKWRNK